MDKFEVQRISYKFDKYSRKLLNYPKWKKFKYYKTMEGVSDGIKYYRNNFTPWNDYSDKVIGVDNNGKRYIIEHITIHRYRIIKLT